MEPRQSVLVVGESLVDVVVDPDGAPRGEHPGGSPMNVALGLARLGTPAHLLTWFGQDERGRRIAEHLAASDVTLVEGSDGAARTSVATATLDGAGLAAYDFDVEWRVPDIPLPANVDCVHTGSIAAFLEPGSAAVERIVRGARGRRTVSFDPNVRPAFLGEPAAAGPRVEALVAGSDVVKVSDEDLAWLYPDQDALSVAEQWLRLGPAVVVVTRGRHGAVGLASTGRVEVPAPAVHVVDTVGAGDAFTSGMLDALASAGLLGGSRREALHDITTSALRGIISRAVQIAALTTTRQGADPPTAAEVAAADAAPGTPAPSRGAAPRT